MKHYIFFALMFFSLHLGAQCVIPITEVSKTIYVPIDEIAYVIPSGTGASIVRQAGLRQLNTVEDVDSIVSLCSPSLLKFTDGSNGKVMAVSKTFIDRIIINGNGKAVIQTKNARIAYVSFEDADDLNGDIIACYGAGESKGIDSTSVRNDSIFLSADGNEFFTGVASGGDGNGIYGGSGVLPGNVVVNAGTANNLKIESTGTLGTQTSLLILNDATVFQSSESAISFQVAGSEKVKISAGATFPFIAAPLASFPFAFYSDSSIYTAPFSNNALFTRLPTRRPTGSNSFWQHNTDGTGRYVTPGAMTVTNPLGGSQTVQGTIDSLYQNSNQIIVATDSFYVNDQNQPVYLVEAGDTITLPAAAEYTAGSGIAISGLGEISATDNSATNELQTLSLVGNDLTLSDGGGTIELPSGADGNGIYGGSGSLPGNVVVNAGTANNLKIESTGTLGAQTSLLILNDATVFQSSESAISLQVGGSEKMKISAGATLPFIAAPIASSPFAFYSDSSIYTAPFSNQALFTRLPTRRPTGINAFWQHNTNGAGQYVTPGAMTVTNPYGGTNTLQATLDSINVAGGDGSITNEGFVGVTAGGATSAVLQGYNSAGTATGAGTTINAGTGLSIAETTSTNGGQITLTNSAPDQTVAISGTGITVGGSYPSFTLTAADQSATNELQTIANTSNATTHTVTLSNSGGSVQLAEGANTTLTTTGNDVNGIVTIAVPVTNPAGGSNTLQAALDSISSTWLKPKLEASNVTINNTDKTLIFNSLNSASSGAYYTLRVNTSAGAVGRTDYLLYGSNPSGYGSFAFNNTSYKLISNQDVALEARIASGGSYKALSMSNTSTGIDNEAFHFSQVGKGAELRLNAGTDTSQYVSLKAPDSGITKWKMTLPTTDGVNGQFLQTNGTGVTTWEFPTAPPDVGGISIMQTAGYTYNAQELGDNTASPMTYNSVVGSKSGMSPTVGQGIQVNFGAAVTCEITAFATIVGTDDWFALQVFVNNVPISANLYASFPNPGADWPSSTVSISHLAVLQPDDVVTIKLVSATEPKSVSVINSGLTVSKNQ